MSQHWTSTLGLVQRAGALVTGEELVIKAIQSNKAKLVIVASDASAGTLKKMTDKTTFYHVRLAVVSDRETLGHALGKHERVSIAIMDQGFATSIMNRIQKELDGQ